MHGHGQTIRGLDDGDEGRMIRERVVVVVIGEMEMTAQRARHRVVPEPTAREIASDRIGKCDGSCLPPDLLEAGAPGWRICNGLEREGRTSARASGWQMTTTRDKQISHGHAESNHDSRFGAAREAMQENATVAWRNAQAGVGIVVGRTTHHPAVTRRCGIVQCWPSALPAQLRYTSWSVLLSRVDAATRCQA